MIRMNHLKTIECCDESFLCLMPKMHGMHPADERKDTSKDCDKGDK